MSHAILSASGAHRWLACPPSARLETQFPDTESDYAKSGSLAHEIAELKLRKAFIEPIGPRKFSNQIKKYREHPLFQEEMLKHTDHYLDYVSGIVHGFASQPYIGVEKRIDFSTCVPEGFGTADCIIIGGDTLHVIDFKYGQGVPVSATNNPQMLLYALGAYSTYSILYAITKVVVSIFQPRVGEPAEFELAVSDLLAWGESIKPIAQLAFAGEGDYKAGDHCRFCRAKAQCRARAEQYLTLEEEYQKAKPPLISNEEVGEILERAMELAKWANDLKELALAACLRGDEIPGWKAVEGRTSRTYVDQDAAFTALMAAGIQEAILYERRPLTVPAIEKVLGKPDYRKLLEEPGHVKTEPGKPTLAPASDNRQAIKPLTAEQAFGTPEQFGQPINMNGGSVNEQSA